ncbi:MAG: YtpR family tRNA-binding protein [Sporolactobacillus sp.]
MIYYYNRAGIGDVLIAYQADSDKTAYERMGDVVKIFDAESGKTLGYNFFNISGAIRKNLSEGLLKPDGDLIAQLNALLLVSGFTSPLEMHEQPLIVTGVVRAMKKHPNSDHMHVCTVDVGKNSLQIVCGAPNIDEGQHVVVARVGALMPSGLIIRPAVLRGVASEGMICSARELDLPDAPQKRGILVLDRAVEPGQNFSHMAESQLNKR